MKGLTLIASSMLFLSASVCMADASSANSSTSGAATTGKNWTCTTNASSSSVAADKAADDQMKTPGAASDAFALAVKNCRDCTKITCETQS